VYDISKLVFPVGGTFYTHIYITGGEPMRIWHKH